MEERGTTGDNFKQLYSHISQITYHITVTWTSIQLHYNSITQLMTTLQLSVPKEDTVFSWFQMFFPFNSDLNFENIYCQRAEHRF